MAQTEQASQQSETASPTNLPGVTAGSAAVQSIGANVTAAVSRRSSASATRTLIGIALIVLSVATYVLIERGIEAEPLRLISLLLAAVALVIALFEASSIIKTRSRLESPLDLFPAAGVFLLALGALGDGYSPSLSAPELIATGPIFAAGVLLLVHAARLRTLLIANRAHLFLESDAALQETAKGQRLTLAEGAVVSADACIERGCCSVLERYLSPETHFRIKEEGDVVFAGSEVVGGAADAVALSSSDDSCLRSLEKLVCSRVEGAGLSLHNEGLRARRATGYILLFVAVACAILWDERVGHVWNTLSAAGLVLLSAIICQLSESLHARQRAMVRRWARFGFVAASDRALQELASAKKVLFDPSRVDLGSLIRVRELEILDDRVGRLELCGCLATLLGRAEDMLLGAAGDYCQEQAGRVAPERVLELQEVPGVGICGRVKGVAVLIGTEEFLLERGVLIHPSESIAESSEDQRPLLVAVGGELVARFWIVFGQQPLVEEGAAHSVWHNHVSPAISTGILGEADSATILVRGQESDILGRSAEIQVTQFAGDRFELPRSTLVTLTKDLSALPALITDSHRYLRLVERTRILVAFGVFLSVATVFLGFFSPIVAGLCLGVGAGMLALR